MDKLALVRKFGKIISSIKMDQALLRLQKVVRKGNYIRAIIYHDTPERFAHLLEQHFAFYQKHFSPVSRKDLNLFFKTGRWNQSKPGLMITFDDGLKSNFEVACPLLEKFGFTGWFLIPTGFVNTPPENQAAFARQHNITHLEANNATRLAMNWDEIRRLNQDHEVGCHTESHLRMSEGLSKDVLQKEIVEAKRDLEKRLGHEVDLFCWVGGELSTYTRKAFEMVQKAGYQYALMTNSKAIHSETDPLFLDRTYVEPFWQVSEVAFMISGIVDLFYTKKRKTIAKRLLI